MAPPAAKAVNPPATLPPEFSQWDQGGPPETLSDSDFQTPPKSKGLIESAFDQTGIPSLYHAFADPATKEETASGYDAYGNTLGRAAMRLGRGMIEPTVSNVKAAREDLKSGNKAGALAHSVSAIPVLGPIMDTATDQYGDKNYAGEAGTLLGAGAMAMLPKAIPEAIEAFPSRARAVATLRDIEGQAANTPVPLMNTTPALQEFQTHVNTGGKGAPVMKKLSPFVQPNAPALNFPEARKFYTNVSDVTRKPGPVRSVFESSRNPRLRAAAGPVREGLNADLVAAADSLQPPRGADYSGAIKEYSKNAKIRGALKKTAVGAIPLAAGALGAEKIHKVMSPLF